MHAPLILKVKVLMLKDFLGIIVSQDTETDFVILKISTQRKYIKTTVYDKEKWTESATATVYREV